MKKLLIYRTFYLEDKFAVSVFKSFIKHRNINDDIDYIYADKSDHIPDIIRNSDYFKHAIHTYDKIIFLGFGDINLEYILSDIGISLRDKKDRIEVLYPRVDINIDYNRVLNSLNKDTRQYLGIDGNLILVYTYLLKNYLGIDIYTRVKIKAVDRFVNKLITMAQGKLHIFKNCDLRNVPEVSWHDIDWLFSEYL